MDWIKRNRFLKIRREALNRSAVRSQKARNSVLPFGVVNRFLMLFFFFMLFQIPTIDAQDAGQREYLRSPLQERTAEGAWNRATNGLDYSKRKKKKEKERRENEPVEQSDSDAPRYGEGSLFDGDWSAIFKVLFFVIIIGFLAFLTLRLVGGNPFLANKKIEKEHIQYSIEEVEADIHKSDLEGFARHALDSENYKLAIRLYYLQIIKLLSQNKNIKWKRDKTNKAYVREMHGTEYYKEFRTITRLFERVWYGDVNIKETDFDRMRPQFLEFLKRIS